MVIGAAYSEGWLPWLLARQLRWRPRDWASFLRGSPSYDEVLDFGRMMGGKYGFDVHY